MDRPTVRRRDSAGGYPILRHAAPFEDDERRMGAIMFGSDASSHSSASSRNLRITIHNG
jgi:hypothetical protein